MPAAASTDYVDSYYARSLADNLKRPALEGDVEAEVCVVGGGMIRADRAWLSVAQPAFQLAAAGGGGGVPLRPSVPVASGDHDGSVMAGVRRVRRAGRDLPAAGSAAGSDGPDFRELIKARFDLF